jgi:hypothetical protein
MRQLMFLFSIVLMAACGCGKNTSSPAPAGTPAGSSNQAPAGASAQTANPIPVPASPQTDDESLYPPPDTNRPYVDVDVIVHNGTTNDYWFSFDSGLNFDIPTKIYSAGESVTNPGMMWANWAIIKIIFGKEQTGEMHSLDIPLAEVNDQLASGKNHRLLFQILDPDKVELRCE